MSLNAVKIGNVAIEPNLALAPMSGVTNSCFRQLIRRLNPGHVGLLVTEFISIEGITRENEQSLRMMRFVPEERPISIQIFGHDPRRMADAAKMVEDTGADIVDINSGCPVPKVVKKGGGCELMRQPEHLARILEAVVSSVSIPLTLKIRAGWDSQSRNAVEIAHIAEQCGVQMLAVHGRTRQDAYRGEADWGLVSEVAASVRIPVFGSGDVVDPESAALRLQSGVSGIMIGRAALAHPWVFSEIALTLQGQTFSRPNAAATAVVLGEYMALLSEYISAKAVLGRMKQLASQITRRVHNSASIRRTLCSASTVEEFSEILAAWQIELESKDNGLTDSLIASAALSDIASHEHSTFSSTLSA